MIRIRAHERCTDMNKQYTWGEPLEQLSLEFRSGCTGLRKPSLRSNGSYSLNWTSLFILVLLHDSSIFAYIIPLLGLILTYCSFEAITGRINQAKFR